MNRLIALSLLLAGTTAPAMADQAVMRHHLKTPIAFSTGDNGGENPQDPGHSITLAVPDAIWRTGIEGSITPQIGGAQGVVSLTFSPNPGLSYAAGTIRGTIMSPGITSITATASDDQGGSPGVDTFQIETREALGISVPSSISVLQNAPLSTAFALSGDLVDAAGAVWDDTSLPGWLSLDAANRRLTGTPTVPMVHDDLQIGVTDPHDGHSATSNVFAVTVVASHTCTLWNAATGQQTGTELRAATTPCDPIPSRSCPTYNAFGYVIGSTMVTWDQACPAAPSQQDIATATSPEIVSRLTSWNSAIRAAGQTSTAFNTAWNNVLNNPPQYWTKSGTNLIAPDGTTVGYDFISGSPARYRLNVTKPTAAVCKAIVETSSGTSAIGTKQWGSQANGTPFLNVWYTNTNGLLTVSSSTATTTCGSLPTNGTGYAQAIYNY